MVDEMSKSISTFGPGVVAIAIIFALFVFIVVWKLKADAQSTTNRLKVEKENSAARLRAEQENNERQREALLKVAESNNNVASALKIIQETFVTKTNAIEAKVEKTLDAVIVHKGDAKRIEECVEKIHEKIIKIDERTSKKSYDKTAT